MQFITALLKNLTWGDLPTTCFGLQSLDSDYFPLPEYYKNMKAFLISIT